MDKALHYAFMDESGTVGAVTGTHFLVIVALTTTKPRELELLVRRALKKYGRRLKFGEIKAARVSEKTNMRMLAAIAEHDVHILAVIVDQKAIIRPPKDPEEIYRQAVMRVAHLLVERFPRIEIFLDKRYTSESLRYLLEKHIREGLVDFSHQLVLLRQQSSHTRKEIQVADAVAWALFQKYERRDARFYDQISSKIIVEELIAKKAWK